MENLRKVISLHQASQISGYHPDYLSALIRKGEIKGQKMVGSWFTTEEEVRDYIFRQKIRNKNWVVKYFLLSKRRVNSSLVYAFIFLAFLSIVIYFYNQKYDEIQPRAEAQEEFNELQF
jgi:hypothetical protein